MGDNSTALIAGNLTAAIIQKLDLADANDGIREATRVYRILLRRIKRVHEEEERLDAVLDEPSDIA